MASLNCQAAFVFGSIAWLRPPASPSPAACSTPARERSRPQSDAAARDEERRRALSSRLALRAAYWEDEVGPWLLERRAALEDLAFVSYDAEGRAGPSAAYAFDDFFPALRAMAVGGVGGEAEPLLFYTGQYRGYAG